MFELGYYSKGGMSFGDVYEMPVYLRNFYYRTMRDTLQQESDARTKAAQPKDKGWRPERPNVKKATP